MPWPAADQANLAKSEFLSSMSHELRTPLNAILGFAQLIESGTPPPTAPQQRSVEQILKAGWYLLDLINEILDLALIESGKLSLSLEPMSLAEVLRECQAMIEPQAQQARHQRDVSAACDADACVKADRTRLKQVLINLLSNAIKYNRERRPVDGGLHASRGRSACASPSRDTGEGLPPEQLAQLFQPFNRLGQEARVGRGHRHRPGGEQAPGRADGRRHRRRKHGRARAACSGSSWTLGDRACNVRCSRRPCAADRRSGAPHRARRCARCYTSRTIRPI